MSGTTEGISMEGVEVEGGEIVYFEALKVNDEVTFYVDNQAVFRCTMNNFMPWLLTCFQWWFKKSMLKGR